MNYLLVVGVLFVLAVVILAEANSTAWKKKILRDKNP
jgi:hypothetical protein